jgi:hypothetical protein
LDSCNKSQDAVFEYQHQNGGRGPKSCEEFSGGFVQQNGYADDCSYGKNDKLNDLNTPFYRFVD